MDISTPLQGITLAQRLREAPLPVTAVLQHALQLANTIRLLHEQGRVCGALDPAQIVIDEGRAALDPAASRCIPYTPPEVLRGQPADVRSDIFTFGCLVYLLLTGRQPFSGGTEQEIQGTILEGKPEPLEAAAGGDTIPVGLTRLVMQCLERNPEQRWQRMHTVYMELKLLQVAARRAETMMAPRDGRVEAALRQEIARVEQTLLPQVVVCNQSVVEAQRAVAGANVRLQSAVETQQRMRASLAAVEQELATLRDTMVRLEAGLSESARITACVEDTLSTQLASVEDQLSRQVQSIAALHTSVAQTDNLLERVVESFDSLQSLMLDQGVSTRT